MRHCFHTTLHIVTASSMREDVFRLHQGVLNPCSLITGEVRAATAAVDVRGLLRITHDVCGLQIKKNKLKKHSLNDGQQEESPNLKTRI